MENNYPRTIILQSEELKTLIEEKGKLITEGRAKSVEIEKLEAEMEDINKSLIEEEKKVDLTEFHKKEKAVTKRMEKCIADIEVVKDAIFAKIKAETPQELRDKYETVNKQKEEAETERNKIALEAQKYNDLIIPLSRDLIKPSLQDEWEDNDSIMIKDGEIVASIFSHLNDFKIQFNTRKK